jgi:DNA polymerase-3 subunit epsilon
MQLRQIVLDTETTGLDPLQGHRVIEIGCVELLYRRLTGRHFHVYLQPDRDIDAAAGQVHGITLEFLADKPRFADIAAEFLEFVKGAELIIHNAPFDIGFLEHELGLWGQLDGSIADFCGILDTLQLARQLHPGQRNTLDALCKRYNVDNTERSLHGALLDAHLLAHVYLAMTGGQVALDLELARLETPRSGVAQSLNTQRPALVVIRASLEECAAHIHYLENLDSSSGGNCVWKRLDAGD